MEHRSKQEIAQLLRDHGVQPTSQRVEIAHVLYEPQPDDGDHHLSADRVLERVNADYHRCSKATVYNTLRLFEEKGLIRDVVVSANKVFFDPNTDPHHHLYNEADGTLRDIPAEELDVQALMPSLPDGVAGPDLDIVIRVRDRGG